MIKRLFSLFGILFFSDENDLRLALNGKKYWAVLWDLDQLCRSKIKYEELTHEEHQAYQSVRDLIYEQIDMDEIE